MAPRIDYHSDPEWVIVEDVPILDEHTLIVPEDKEKGKPAKVVTINADFLRELADNNNRLVNETGDWIPLTEGHTIDGAAEKDQPEILGYADFFKVGDLVNALDQPTGRKAILSRWRISKEPEKLAKAKRLTRRSVELWLDRKEINPIALLGSTAPERNLGILRLSRMAHQMRGSDGKLRYGLVRVSEPFRLQAMPYASPTMQPATPQTPCPPVNSPSPTGMGPQVDPAMVQAIVAALGQTDTFVQMQTQLQQLAQQMQMLTGGGMMGQPGMGGVQPGMGGEDPMAALLAQLGQGQQGQQGQGNPAGGKDKDGDGTEDETRIPMDVNGPGMTLGGNSMMGLPSGTNPFIPNALTRDKIPLPRAMMNHQSYQRQGETLEQTIVRLGAERDEAIKLSRKSTVMNELTALALEGVPIDTAELQPVLESMTDEQRAFQYKLLRDLHIRYQRGGQVVRPGQQTTTPNLPQLQVPNPAVGQDTPDARYQRTAANMDAPMTLEEKAPCMELVQLGYARDMQGALKLYRQGMAVRNGQQPVTQVY